MALPFNDLELNNLRSTLAKRESSGDSSVVNQLGFVGLYQFGAAALEDVGLLKAGMSKQGNKVINNPDAWTIPGGVESFKKDTKIQDEAVNKLMSINYNRLKSKGVISSNTSKDEIAGYLFASHLGGSGNAAKLAKGVEFKDANGTKISEYFNLGKNSQIDKTLDTTKDVSGNTLADPMAITSMESRGELIIESPEDSANLFGELNLNRESNVRADVNFLDGFKAGFRRENPIYNLLESQNLNPDDVINPDFNPLDQIGGYEEFSKGFIDLPNQEAVDKYKEHLDTVRERSDTVQRGGMGAILGSISGGILSPTTLIPGVGVLSKGTLAAKIAKGAALTAGAVGADELSLQRNDETRTLEESIANTAAAALIGGVLTGVISKKLGTVVSPETRGLAESYMKGKVEVVVDVLPNSTTGAKQAYVPTLAGEGIVKTNKTFDVALKALRKTSPVLRTLEATSAKARELTNKLASHDFILGKNLKGVVSDIPVEARVDAGTGRIYGAIDTLDRARVDLGKSGIKMSASEFDSAVLKTMRTGKSEIPAVKKAATEMNSYYRALHKRLGDAGILSDDLKTWTKFKAQVVNGIDNAKIATDRVGFEKAIRTEVKKQFGKLVDITELEEASDEIINNIVTGKIGNLNRYQITKGELDGKVLSLKSDVLGPYRYTDLRKNLVRMTRQSEIEKAYKDVFGETTINKELRNVENEYDKLINKNPQIAEKLVKEKNSILRDLKAMDERLRGVYKMPEDPYSMSSKALNATLALNYTTKLGGAAITQIADLARMVGIVKLGETVGADVQKLGKVLKGAKLTNEELKLLNIGTETYMNSRALEIGEMGHLIESTSKWDEGIEQITNTFSKISGLSPMNDFTKRMTAKYFANTAIQDFQLWNKGLLSNEKVAFYLRRGMSKENANKTLKEFSKHGKTVRGVNFANTHLWGTDGDTFKQLLKKEVDSVIVTPGIGDKPLWMSSGIGKILGQFKSFSFASTNKLLLPSLQQGDALAAGKMFTGTALGSVVYITKELLKGNEPDLSTMKLITEGVDRSGVTGIIYDINNLVEGSLGIGINKALGTSPSTRRGFTSVVKTIAGPTGGLIEDAGKGGRGILDVLGGGDMTSSDINSLKKLVPGNNLFYLKWLLTKVGEKK